MAMPTFYTGTACADTTVQLTNCWLTWTADSGTTNGITAAPNVVWHTWTSPCDTISGGTISGTSAIVITPAAQQTIDDWQAKVRERAARALADQREAERRRAEAQAKAQTLLQSLLSDDQLAHWQQQGYFEVVARGSRRRYRIFRGSHGNVYALNPRGEFVVKYCGQPSGVPIEDMLIAQKLQIEYDEDEFLKRANGTRLAGAA
jgi:hypothetical protein